MPLPAPQARSHLHTRAVVFRGYHREDGLWDIEAELTDTKGIRGQIPINLLHIFHRKLAVNSS